MTQDVALENQKTGTGHSRVSPDPSCLLVQTNIFFQLVADAYGSWPIEGELEGNRYSLGSYYSCMELEVNPAPGEDFRGQYCHAVSFISGREILDGSNINAKDRLLLPRSHPLAPPFPDGLDDPLFQVSRGFTNSLNFYLCLSKVLLLCGEGLGDPDFTSV